MLSDEEILKRIAEIEGVSWNPAFGAPAFKGAASPMVQARERWEPHWNPLHDWSDLGPLIEKYKVNICPPFEGKSLWRADVLGSYGDAGIHKSLRHAILLAIIEAHDEKQVG